MKPPADVRFMLGRAHDTLICPGVATDLLPFFYRTWTSKLEYYDALVSILGDRGSPRPRPSRASSSDWLDATVSGDVRFYESSSCRSRPRFASRPRRLGDGPRPRPRAGQGRGDLDSDDVDVLVRSRDVDGLLEWHHEHRKAFQIAVGCRVFPFCDGKSIPRFQEDLDDRDGPCAFHRFGNCRFDLLMASDASWLTRRPSWPGSSRTVYVSGYLVAQLPAAADDREETMAMRFLMVAPMTKFGGFTLQTPITPSGPTCKRWSWARRWPRPSPT